MTEDEIILTHILQCRAIDLAVNKPVLSPVQKEQFQNYKRRRLAGEPLQYILGTCNFMGLELAVNPSVLVPRPETEQLVDQALKVFKGGIALDLGTGSGNIAIALAKFTPQSKIVTIEKSAEALKVARDNARRHGVEDRIQFVHDDFLTGFERPSPWACGCNKKAFDLVISNPPYIPTGQLNSLPKDVQQEPVTALDGGEDGLKFYRIIIKYTPYLLSDGGCLMMEFGDGQAEAVKKLTEDRHAFSNITIDQDLSGRNRIIKATL